MANSRRDFGVSVGALAAYASSSARPRAHGFVASCFLFTLLATLFLPMTASAGDQDNSFGKSGEGLHPTRSLPERRLTSSTPRWTVSAEAIVLGRLGGVNQTLVARVPGVVPFYLTSTAPGTEAFNSNQFQQGFSAGPKMSLTYHGDSGYGAELSYFNIFNQSATKAIGPDSPADWLVMKAPGFWQTQDFPYQAMAWKSTTNLYNAEANGRLDLSSRVTMLAGFRWLQLNDNLQGTLPPADLTAPTWKQNYGFNIFQVPARAALQMALRSACSIHRYLVGRTRRSGTSSRMPRGNEL